MNTQPNFRVEFGRIARTLVYEDDVGAVAFTFDVSPSQDPSKGAWTMHLGLGPVTPDGTPFQISAPVNWIAAAREQAKQFLLGIGYEVKDDPPPRPMG